MQLKFLFCAAVLFLLKYEVRGHGDDNEPKLDLNIDHSKYVDPHDMFNYDLNSQRRFKRQINVEDPLSSVSNLGKQNNHKTPEDISFNEVMEAVVSSEKDLLGSQQSSPNEQVQPGSCAFINRVNEAPFLLRFLRILSDLLSFKEIALSEGEEMKVSLIATITKQYKFVIEEILKNGNEIPQKRLAELDEVLSNMFTVNEKLQAELDEGSFLQRMIQSASLHAKDWLVVMHLLCVINALVLALSGHSLRGIIQKSVMPILVVSWYWHWHHLDERAAAKRQSEMAKTSQQPAACNPDTLDTWNTVKLFVSTAVFRYDDPCDEYHRALLTNPTYEVSPFFALVDMLATGIFHPLKYIGEQFGGFFDGVLNSTGFFTKTPVFLAVLVVMLFLILLLCGYEFHTPLLKITNTRALTAAQIQNALHTQALLETQALERDVRRESRALERGSSTILHDPKIESVNLTSKTLRASTQSDNATSTSNVQAIESSASTREAEEKSSSRRISETSSKNQDIQEASNAVQYQLSESQLQPTNTSPMLPRSRKEETQTRPTNGLVETDVVEPVPKTEMAENGI